jgi:uncharacterized membrane protein (DUF373 family)
VVALFGLMLRALAVLFRGLVAPTLEFGVVIAEVLFMLVMIEVVRLLIVYLREHRVAVDFMVELGIVATLREVMLHGVTELSWQQLGALAFLLMALGALLRFGDLRIPLPAVSGHAVRASDDAGAFRGPSRREAARWTREPERPQQ